MPFEDMLGDLSSKLEGMGAMPVLGMGPLGMGDGGRGRDKKQTLSVKKALEQFTEELEEELTNEEEVQEAARMKAEQYGIVFIDEIDKLCGGGRDTVRSASEHKGEGVQRELLTLVEGCSVPTRYGPIKTDHVLFIASGAFHSSAPSDLLPELQGRFPVRVELKPLQKADLVRILSEKKFNLIEQTVKLLETEGVHLEFTEDGIDAIAGFAAEINKRNQDIGARRLNTVMHRVVEDLSFRAPRLRGTRVKVDAAFVQERIKDFDPMRKDNLARYIL